MKSKMQITLSGLRGGVGTTSLAAMLADALRLLNESVLIIDLNASDLLRLHFNIPYAELNGWAFAKKSNTHWQQHTYQIDHNLWVLPYGRHGLTGLDIPLEQINGESFWAAEATFNTIAHSKTAPNWIIFDVPSGLSAYAALHQSSDIHFLVSQPDMASHILLGQYPLNQNSNTKIMINGFNPAQQLNESVVLDWNIRYAQQLAPVRLNHDSHVHEALAHKMPATTYFPESAAAQNMLSLAMWCLTQRGQLL